MCQSLCREPLDDATFRDWAGRMRVAHVENGRDQRAMEAGVMRQVAATYSASRAG